MKATSPEPATRGKSGSSIRSRAYPVYRVVRYRRPDRAALAVEASEVTLDEASDLAATLRAEHRGDEALFGFAVQTLPLSRQAVILDFPERPAPVETPPGPDPYGPTGLAAYALGCRLAALEV
jgi:hypothetical protein